MADARAAADEAGRDQRRARLVALALRIAADAGWISVVYAAAAVLADRGEPVIGPIELAGLVALGTIVARWGRPRPEIGAVVLIGAVVAGGAAGWLLSAEARSLLGNPAAALSVHLAGWLGALAVARGAALAGGEDVARQLEGLLRVVPIVLALVWGYTSLAALPALWLSFAVSAMWGTVVFFATALPAIGWARLEVLHANVADESRRRDWRYLVTAAGVGAVIIALPVVLLTDIPVDRLLQPVAGPFQWLVGLIAIPLSWIVWLSFELLRPVAGPLDDALKAIGERFFVREPGDPVDPNSLAGIVAGALGLLLAVITIAVLLGFVFLFARWMLVRSRRDDESDAFEPNVERTIVVPDPVARARPGSSPRSRLRPPRDVVTAYLNALRELEPHAAYARRPAETPAGHGARVRAAGMPAAAHLARLAAAYQLARYANRRMTSTEDARAVTRLQRLKRALRG